MSNEIAMLEKDGLLDEYITEFAEMILECETPDIEEFYTRISEDLVSKGAYLSQEEDVELIKLLTLRSDAVIQDIIADKRRNILHQFVELGVELQ